MLSFAIGVDLGGTNLRIAAIEETGAVPEVSHQEDSTQGDAGCPQPEEGASAVSHATSPAYPRRPARVDMVLVITY